MLTSGYPSDATENAVQANITAAGYGSGSSNPQPGHPRRLQRSRADPIAKVDTISAEIYARVGLQMTDRPGTATVFAQVASRELDGVVNVYPEPTRPATVPRPAPDNPARVEIPERAERAREPVRSRALTVSVPLGRPSRGLHEVLCGRSVAVPDLQSRAVRCRA